MYGSKKRILSALIAIVFVGLTTFGEKSSAKDDKLNADEATQIGVDAYIYGYSLVTMEMTRRVMTNVATVQGMRGPMGQFLNAREYPSAAFRDVTAPNADTLYSVAWLDLAKEPYIVSLPDEDGRYYLLPCFLDGPMCSKFLANARRERRLRSTH